MSEAHILAQMISSDKGKKISRCNKVSKMVNNCLCYMSRWSSSISLIASVFPISPNKAIHSSGFHPFDYPDVPPPSDRCIGLVE